MQRSLSNQKILVTGATGSLGSQILYELAKLDMRPVAGVRRGSNTGYIDSLQLEKRFADLRNRDELNQITSGIDVVIHTAAWVNFRQDRFTQFTSINTFGAVDLYKAARLAGVKRFVHVSSIAAVGAVPRNGTRSSALTNSITEECPFNLGNLRIPYILSKRAAEEELLQLAHRGSPELLIVNPSIVVAPSSTGDDRSRSMRIFGRSFLPDIRSSVNLVDIRDVAPATVAAAVDGRPGQRYILAGENISVHNLTLMASEILGRKPVLVSMPRSLVNFAAGLSVAYSRFRGRGKIRFYPDLLRLLDFDWVYSAAKAASELGFRSRPLETTLGELLTNQFTGTWLRP